MKNFLLMLITCTVIMIGLYFLEPLVFGEQRFAELVYPFGLVFLSLLLSDILIAFHPTWKHRTCRLVFRLGSGFLGSLLTFFAQGLYTYYKFDLEYLLHNFSGLLVISVIVGLFAFGIAALLCWLGLYMKPTVIPPEQKQLAKTLKFVRFGVSVVILAIIWLVGPTYCDPLGIRSTNECYRAKVSEMILRDLGTRLKHVCASNSSLPADVMALTRCTGVIPDCDWGINADSFRDAWGRGILYEREGEKAFRLKSLGSDGKEGGSGYAKDIGFEGKCE